MEAMITENTKNTTITESVETIPIFPANHLVPDHATEITREMTINAQSPLQNLEI